MKPQAYQKPTIYNSDGTKAQIGTYDIRTDPLTNSTADGILDYINNNLEAQKAETYTKTEVDNKIGSINKLPSNFQDINGNICVTNDESTGIVGKINNNDGTLGSTGSNINIKSWFGVGFINGNPNFDNYNKVTVGIDARNGRIFTHNLVATEYIKAPNLVATDSFTAPNIYTKSEVDNKIATDGMPTGTVLAFAGNTVPNNYLLCDGSAVSRSTYANLFKVIGTTYGAGDGSTTFNLPNLVDKFVEGSATAGTVKSAGLPNITGGISPFVMFIGGSQIAPVKNQFGALTNLGHADDRYKVSQGGTDNNGGSGFDHGIAFNASLSNPIYGKSTTVQPPALTMRYIIKY